MKKKILRFTNLQGNTGTYETKGETTRLIFDPMSSGKISLPRKQKKQYKKAVKAWGLNQSNKAKPHSVNYVLKYETGLV